MAASSEFGNWQVAIDAILDTLQHSETFNTFSQLRSNEDRVRFIYREKLLKQVKWLPLYFDACKKWHGKSSEVAQVWRNKGNKLFQQKKYNDAIDAYTQSCLNAPVDKGDDFSLSLGNRSAALFHLGDYQDCITDINRAVDHRFPPDSLHKLLARKTSSYIRLEQRLEAENSLSILKDFMNSKQFSLSGSKKDEFLKEVGNMERSIGNLHKSNRIKAEDKEMPSVSFGKNPVVCQATDAVSLHFTEDKGRHLLASRHIPKGSTVIVERPFAAVLLPEHYETHCHHCFLPLPLTSLGCRRCTSVRFCSEKCQDVAWSSYHKTECPYLDLFHSIGIAHLSLRVILCAKLDFLTDFLNNNSKYRQSNEESAKGINVEGRYDRSYLTVYDLMTHEESTLSQDMLQYSLTAALLLSTLAHAGFFSKICESDDSHDLAEQFTRFALKSRNEIEGLQDLFDKVYAVGGLLLRHILQLVCNAHAITSLHASSAVQGGLPGITQDTEQTRIATAIYPTASLMNHSCDPTIISSFIGDVLVVRTVKDVDKGEEIYNCYGPHFCRMSREERQEILKYQYHFDCKCPPCQGGDVSHQRFSAFKCPQCAGVLGGHSCLECSYTLDKEALARLYSRAEQASRLFSRAVKLMSSQDHDGALKLLEECQSERKQFLYKDHKDLAILEDAIARCYADMGEFGSSADHLLTSVKFTALMYGDRSIEYANELQKLAEVLFRAERFTECLDVSSQSLSLFETLYSPEHEMAKQVRELRDAAVQVLTPLMQAH